MAVCMAVFSACNNDDDNNPATPQLNSTDQAFMRMAVMGNNAEIQTSRLALTRSQDTAVRNYAQMMIDHHTAANRSLDSLARLRNFTVPDSSQLDSSARSLLTRLNSLNDSTGTGTGTDTTAAGGRSAFSREYMNGQVTLHTKAQSDYQTYINNQQGQDAGLKAYANRTLPVITSHLQMAQAIVSRNQYGQPSTPPSGQ